MSDHNNSHKLIIMLFLFIILVPTPIIGNFAFAQPDNHYENDFTETDKQVTRSSISIEGNPALIVLSTDTRKSMQEASDYVSEIGGRVLNIYPTHVLVAYLTKSHSQILIEREDIENISFTSVDSSSVSKYGEQAVLAVDAWNRYVQNQLFSNLEKTTDASGLVFIDGDARVLNKKALRNPDNISPSPYGSKRYDTSEYMIGDISVVLIFPESNGEYDGNQENWASWDFPILLNEIQDGLNWWALREPATHLSFTISSHVVPTQFEPINRPQSQEGLWIGDVMDNLGYSDESYFQQVYSLLNDVRDADGTDWAVAVFIAHSFWDLDVSFPDGFSAYAYQGGPFIVMTYDNGGWGVSNMDGVFAHELGHTFYALDEYWDAQEEPDMRAGYLNVDIQNTEYGGTFDLPCIMKEGPPAFSTESVCPHTRGQIGWSDADEDGILDIVDFYPDNRLDKYKPDPTTDTTPTLYGKATSKEVYPNENPAPWNSGNDITINIIDEVWFWVRDHQGDLVRESQYATAVDGSFNSASEEYYFTVSPKLEPGVYSVYSIAWTPEGNGYWNLDNLTISGEIATPNLVDARAHRRASQYPWSNPPYQGGGTDTDLSGHRVTGQPPCFNDKGHQGEEDRSAFQGTYPG